MSDVRAVKLVRNQTGNDIDVINMQHPNKAGNHVTVPARGVAACDIWTPWCDSQHQLDGKHNNDQGTRDDAPRHISVTPARGQSIQIFQHDSPVWYTKNVVFGDKVIVNGDAQAGKGDYELIIHTDMIPEYKKI